MVTDLRTMNVFLFWKKFSKVFFNWFNSCCRRNKHTCFWFKITKIIFANNAFIVHYWQDIVLFQVHWFLACKAYIWMCLKASVLFSLHNHRQFSTIFLDHQYHHISFVFTHRHHFHHHLSHISIVFFSPPPPHFYCFSSLPLPPPLHLFCFLHTAATTTTFYYYPSSSSFYCRLMLGRMSGRCVVDNL